jgi:hypothetical protein
LFIEHEDGKEAFREYMRDAAQRYFSFEKQAKFPIHDTETTKLMALLNPTITRRVRGCCTCCAVN